MNSYNKELGRKLFNARKNLGLTMKELGAKVDLHESTIKRYEDGEIKQLDISKVKEFARVLRISPIYLLGWEESTEYTNSINIPVYGSIPAGVALEAIEDIQGYEDIPIEWLKGDKEFIALKVKGDSMYPKYLEGDTVIILVQQDCESGQDAACYVNGYDATLKKIIKTDSHIELKPINPNYPPKTYKENEVEIVGVVKELRRTV